MRVVVLGVSGVAGRAIAGEFARSGHDVVGTGRQVSHFPAALGERGVGWVSSDRFAADQFDAVLGEGADVVVDCLCYSAEHARALVARRDRFGSAVALSSKAVYVDDHGRHANSEAPPHFDGPIPEDRAVLEPDFSGAYASREGYGRNKVAAEVVLRESGVAVSILRASRIHGPGASPMREWFVLRRLLDGRRRIPVAHGGRGANHPTSAANLARLATWCGDHPGARVLNVADPGCPTAADMTESVAGALGEEIEVVGLGDDAPAQFGWTPWSSWPPVFLDTSASLRLGYQPAGEYALTVTATVDALMSLSAHERAECNDSEYFAGRFDYRLDDDALSWSDRADRRT